MFKIIQKFHKCLDGKVRRIDDISFIVEKIHEFVCFWSIGDHDEWESMDTGEYPRVIAHTDDRMECRVDFESLFERSCGVVGLSCHNTFDEKCIVLRLTTSCRVDEKYRIISSIKKCLIDEWDFDFAFSEKSSSNRDTDTFFFWFLVDCFRYEEKCDIRDL